MTAHRNAAAQIRYAIDNTFKMPGVNAWNPDLEEFIVRLHQTGVNAFVDDAALGLLTASSFSGAFDPRQHWFYQSGEEALVDVPVEDRRPLAEYLRARATELRQRMPEMEFLLAGQRYSKKGQYERIARITTGLLPDCEVRLDPEQPEDWIRAGFFYRPGVSAGTTLHERLRTIAEWSDRDLARQIAARLGAFAEMPQ